MSWVTLAPPRERPGHLACACDLTLPDAPDTISIAEPALALAAAGFGLTVLTQALTNAVLPMAGSVLAPSPAWAVLPYALTLIGAAVATLPAAVLTDVLGRRAALALGASLGLAGGCIAAWGFVEGQFAALALGSFWLGIAQGFGFFYRHAPAMQDGDKPRAIVTILGSGCLAAVAAPAMLSLAQSGAGPLAPAAALIFVGGIQILIIGLAVATRPGHALRASVQPAPTHGARRILLAASVGAAAWFGMTLLMAASPSLMALCGIAAPATAGILAWHVLWMYGPAAIALPLLKRLGSVKTAVVGLSLVVAALAGAMHLETYLGFALILAMGGTGWSLAMLGVTMSVYAAGSPSPRLLAMHDCILLAGAVAGAFAAGLIR